MKEWFYGLEGREQIAVIAGTVAVAFAILFFGIWRPLAGGEAALGNSVSTWERSLAELRPLRSALSSASGSRTASAGQNQSLVVIVDTTLRDRGLYGALQRSQPNGANAIRVEFENVAFDDAVRWLGDLSSRYNLHVQSGNFSSSTQGTPGRVNASLTLER